MFLVLVSCTKKNLAALARPFFKHRNILKFEAVIVKMGCVLEEKRKQGNHFSVNQITDVFDNIIST
jgi:hypothetical protein